MIKENEIGLTLQMVYFEAYFSNFNYVVAYAKELCIYSSVTDFFFKTEYIWFYSNCDEVP